MSSWRNGRHGVRLSIAICAAACLGCGAEPIGELAEAVEAGDRSLMVRLLAEGADPNGIDAEGLTPLIRAVRRGHVRLVSPLTSRGADPELRDSTGAGWTPLLHAIHRVEIDAARALLNSGADPGAPSADGLTPLMMAAGYGQHRVVRLLVERGADPAVEDPEGDRALDLAVRGVFDLDRITLGSCQTDTVRELARAAPELKLEAGSWTVRLARLKGCDEILELVGPV